MADNLFTCPNLWAQCLGSQVSKLVSIHQTCCNNICRQNFTLATMDNCKIFAVIVSITTICSYINFSHSLWQRTAPKQLPARLTRTLSLVWGRTDKFCQVELNALKEKEENLLWWALRENWRSLKHFKRVIVEKNKNENI